MSLQITLERQRTLIEQITRLAAESRHGQIDLREREAHHHAEAQREHDERQTAAKQRFADEHADLSAAYLAAREAVYCDYETAGCSLAREEEGYLRKAADELAESLDAAKALCRHTSQKIQTAYKENSKRPKALFAQFKQQAAGRSAEIDALVSGARQVASRYCEWPEAVVPPPVPSPGASAADHNERVTAAITRAAQASFAIPQQPAARFLNEGWPLLIFIIALLVLAYPCWVLAASIGWLLSILVGFGSALALGIAARQIARSLACRQTLRIAPDFQQAASEARAELAAAVATARAEGERAYQQLGEQRDGDLAAAKNEWKAGRSREKEEYDQRIKRAIAGYAARRQAIEDTHEARFEELDANYGPQLAELRDGFDRQTATIAADLESRLAASRESCARERAEVLARWNAGRAEFEQAVRDMNVYCDERFPDWHPDRCLSTPAAPQDVAALRFGEYAFHLDCGDATATYRLPVALSYPDRPSLLLEAEGEGRLAATRVLQDVMLRLLTTFPPGKVRFTIIDPVGLGENFSAFMHLADFDDRLISSRIWTESAHINQRLADLTEHMENVIQKYLRNEFSSIQEYNADAGEVAEPFQILVIANFPANLSDEAARRLVSIASSGARCGVYTLISTDRKLKLPRNFDPADLEASAIALAWNDEQSRWQWKDAALQNLPLSLEAPPDDQQFTALVRSVGQQAKETARVEVPFELVLPTADGWWTADSRREIVVPLGRAGAKKLQTLRLGKGTSQHVLIAGKTGSGKSTLLNALITNLAAHYSPSELQFYLIDFKKGVEFKAFATFELPHARVIAIESEREFGMSVLERLDVELQRRGDLFRQQGVQDLSAYRDANPAAIMPRILLVIDEFQEFFTSDDKISHDAALLLDRLVRQGRAFGIHVLLGSQTLAGAYTLARSTIGQMAVRIALQCSESDAHLILSEDNAAARLLNRPGEAIYNDANGLIEGNHPFQVAWLSDHQRETCLRRMAEMARGAGLTISPPTIFEGNVPADPATNEFLRDVFQASVPQGRTPALRAWLGASVAIKDPTSVVFRRQTASNLLVVGQNEELAFGMLANCLLALAAQLPRSPDSFPTLFVLDGTHPDSPASGAWAQVCSQTTIDPRLVLPRDAARVVGDIAAEVERRLATSDHAAPRIFLVVHHLAHFRDLKKSDDFGFSLGEEPGASADKQLATILREGPAVGVHALFWCDSYGNLSRWLDRQALRDFDLRVLLQMSAADSSQLMDSPGASRLGAKLAYFYSEESGRAEKFRPYGQPSPQWLAWVSERLAGKAASSAPTTPADLPADHV
jgi:S-DNA-T family DNA segregation ATPase FtsK/SpoIIIE